MLDRLTLLPTQALSYLLVLNQDARKPGRRVAAHGTLDLHSELQGGREQGAQSGRLSSCNRQLVAAPLK